MKLKLINKKKLFLILFFLITGCKQNYPIIFENFQGLRCESNIEEKNNYDYVFNKNTGYLYFYDQIKDKFVLLSERFEGGFFSERSIEFFSEIRNNKLFITTIEYKNNFSNKARKIKHIINLKRLSKKTFEIIGNKNYFISNSKCVWIDPKLGIKY